MKASWGAAPAANGGATAVGAPPAVEPAGLIPEERTAIVAVLTAAVIAVLFPYPTTKVVLGVVLAVLFLAVSVRHFHIAIALFAFFLPLHVLLPPGSYFIRGLNLETIFVIGLLILASAAGSRQAPGGDAHAKNPAAVPMYCYIGVIVLSALWTTLFKPIPGSDPLQDVKTSLIYTVLLFLTFKHIRTDHQRKYVLFFVLLVVALVAAQSMQQVLADGAAFNPARHRATSMMFEQPNLWGGFLAMYSFFFLSALLHGRRTKGMLILTLLGTLLVLVNLAYTQSRGAWLALGGAAVLVGGMKSRKLLVPLIAIGTLVYLLTPDAAIERFESSFEGEYDPALLLNNAEAQEAATRVVQWRSFFPLLRETGILGAGYGQYQRAFEDAGLGEMKHSPHSTLIQVGIEQGVVGLLLYFWLFISIYRAAAAILRETQSSVARLLAVGLLGCTVCLVLLDLSGTRSRNGSLMAFYWLIAGMTLNLASRSSPEVGAPASGFPRRTGVRLPDTRTR